MSEASREVANLTERKNPHTPEYGVKEFVWPLPNSTPIISTLAKQNGLKNFNIFKIKRPQAAFEPRSLRERLLYFDTHIKPLGHHGRFT